MTILELVVVLTIVVILAAVVLPRVTNLRDAIDVRAASHDTEAMLGVARRLAIGRGVPASVSIDVAHGALALLVGTDTIQSRPLHTLHGVTVWSSRSLTTYSPIGAGVGASNLTIILTKGHAADTLTISRLGRVKRS